MFKKLVSSLFAFALLVNNASFANSNDEVKLTQEELATVVQEMQAQGLITQAQAEKAFVLGSTTSKEAKLKMYAGVTALVVGGVIVGYVVLPKLSNWWSNRNKKAGDKGGEAADKKDDSKDAEKVAADDDKDADKDKEEAPAKGKKAAAKKAAPAKGRGKKAPAVEEDAEAAADEDDADADEADEDEAPTKGKKAAPKKAAPKAKAKGKAKGK